MSTIRHDSSGQYTLEPISAAGGAPENKIVRGRAGIWLDGDVLACSCPDCGAPMSIRLWLMVADCFRCGSSIELSQQQEQEALRLLREHEEARRAESAAAAAAISPTMLRKTPQRPLSKPSPWRSEPEITQPVPVPLRRAAVPTPTGSGRGAATSLGRRAAWPPPKFPADRAKVREIRQKGGLAVWWADLLSDLPAWLVSLVVHLVGMLLLALWIENPVDEDREITLATSVSYENVAGEQGEIEEPPIKAFEFEDPGAIEIDSVVDHTAAANEEVATPEPLDPLVDVSDPVGNLPEAGLWEPTPLSAAPMGRMLRGRDPDVRAHAVRRAGGTSYTEAAVARGLKFLARHQNEDGSWSLDQFHQSPDCDDTCTGAGNCHSDMAATALALLPFLGAGQTHVRGEYTDEVFRGLRWIVEHQKDDGDCRGVGGGRMYAHGQATIALCEAYALTADKQLHEPAQAAVNFIVKAQHDQGGWRYRPKQAGDTSVVGWQLMALKSGQMSYLLVPKKTFQMAGRFLDRVQCDTVGGRYAYRPGRGPTDAMTAEALLCRQYLGWPRYHPGLQDGAKFLLEKHPPDVKNLNIYYWYYATQVMHHLGGRQWETWNAMMRRVLVETQEKKGHAAGSWAPRGGGHNKTGGRIYMTSLAVCILEVYYRYLPLYGKQAVERHE